MKKFFLSLACLIFLTAQSSAQDHISWSSFQIEKKINDKWSVSLKPIFRHNLSTNKYLNFSPDYSIKYKINKEWSMMLLGRTWVIPDGPNRQFLWLDINHKKTLGKFDFRNTLRIHFAPDVNIEDADFLRYHPAIVYKGISKIKPLIGLQIFQQLNGVNKIDRIRYVGGFHIPIVKRLDFFFQYWNEVFYNSDNNRRVNIYVSNLRYSF